METDTVEAGGRAIAYQVVRSARRTRTVAVRVEAGAGVVVLAPARLPRGAIRDFVAGRAAWVEAQQRRLASVPAPAPLAGRTSVPFRGGEAPLAILRAGKRVSVRYEGEGLCAVVPPGLEGEALETALRQGLVRWYGEQALAIAEEAVGRFAAIGDPRPARILIRNQKTRWGSCAADGTVRLNWRLARLPGEFADYVVVHELAHLLHRNHGPAFWQAVAAVLPDHRERRARLSQAHLLAAPW